jgi:hypothetical protein
VRWEDCHESYKGLEGSDRGLFEGAYSRIPLKCHRKITNRVNQDNRQTDTD